MVMLFRQGAAGHRKLADLFGLNEVEAAELLTLDRGESVLIKGSQRIPLYTVIPPQWYATWTTNPREISNQKASNQ